MKLVIEIPECMYDEIKWQTTHHQLHFVHQDYSRHVCVAMPVTVCKAIADGEPVPGSYSPSDKVWQDIRIKPEVTHEAEISS